MTSRLVTCFGGRILGKLSHFVLCMVLEWVLMISLFIDGFLAFFTIEFSRFFGLEIPCWLCAKMNHVLAHNTPNFYYNNSICVAHKKDLSSMAFCHNHKKLSDIRQMCEGCLLSFATQKESDCDTYKSLVGVLNKNLDCFVEDGQNIQLSLKDGEVLQDEKRSTQKCACCGAPLKLKSSISRKNSGSFSQPPAALPPICPIATPKSEESPSVDSPQILSAKKDSEVPQNEDDSNLKIQNTKLKEVPKEVALPQLTVSDDMNIESPKTPSLPWSSRFFGVPFTDSPNNSPRWFSAPIKKSPLEKTEFASDSIDVSCQTEEDDPVLNNLKRQVRLDRKSLMALYMELDEERSAAAVAANNAMAMITRLQEEKAALQMDSSQYQRMMEEQIEYDEEVLQETNELLLKLEEEVKSLDTELEVYRDKYGYLTEDDVKAHGGNNSFTTGSIEGEEDVEKNLDLQQPGSSKAYNGEGKIKESLKDFRMERTYLLGRKKMETGTLLTESGI
ncbi:probable myosin-binding protein 5 [Vicia villosa]|uniref:probable myosin-binding protein 5 n=1 Tax=Vicia villosa TaxID=3911 RepID=UPI00273BD6FD|nr:probable myosin-binding protein 5 [Vicia villosa]